MAAHRARNAKAKGHPIGLRHWFVPETAVTIATARVNTGFLPALASRPLSWLLAAAALAGLGVLFRGLRGKRDFAAFLGSCTFLAGLSAAMAVCVFPVMLRATGDPSLSLTARNAGGDPAGLKTALGWFVVGLPLVVSYFVLVLRLHRGKAVAAADGEGY